MSTKKRQIKPLRLMLVIIVLLIAFVVFIKSTTKVVEVIEEEVEELVIDDEVVYRIINNTNKDTIYLAKGDSFRLNYDFESNKTSSTKKLNYSSSNPEIVYVDLNGLIKAIDVGEATITISINNLFESVNIVSTDLILPMNNTKIYSKPYLSCGQYTEEENDLLDALLKERIDEAGYKTRAGVVAAIRFLLIEFPYRIDYFFENGRVHVNNVDGEGRYYHEGLYLDESRYENLSGSSAGPACWGCSLFSYPSNKEETNGLDCSALVTWAMLNGGYDPKDVGAGGVDYSKNTLFYLGKREKTSLKNIEKIQAGDLVHNEKADGHIGMVIGIEEDKVYVAQATWADPRIFTQPYGVVITEYTYQEFVDDWNEVMLMDSYYKENGNYTAMW